MSTPFPNQPPPYEGRNLYTSDPVLREAAGRFDPGNDEALARWGAVMGDAATFAFADAANRNGPVLRTHDRRGERIDAIDFHPAWHALMTLATQAGEHCLPWRGTGSHPHVARAIHYYLHAQVENGTQCPITMTYAAIPVLQRHAGSLSPQAAALLDRAQVPDYDPRPLPVGAKHAALIGMGMTERQGGSDVRANLTRATPDADGAVRITGHKWFFSAPQCDAHLVLAQTADGLSCFLMPRLLPDGARNAIRINRLKDKLGNRSNASAEVEFENALAWPLGASGRGIATILEMVQYTRLDCVIGSAGMMRGAIAWALHHARHRIAFGRALAGQPLMQNVLADLALEAEAALLLALRLARCVDAPEGGADRALARLAIPAAKYWVCKRTPHAIFEAMEALGGNGYVEDNPLPRAYREAPVNSIWEGSGNVIALDVARAVAREPAARDAVLVELTHVRGANRHLDHAAAQLVRDFDAPVEAFAARTFAQRLACALGGVLLVEHSPAHVADAYCETRLGEGVFGGAAFGCLPRGVDAVAIVERALAP